MLLLPEAGRGRIDSFSMRLFDCYWQVKDVRIFVTLFCTLDKEERPQDFTVPCKYQSVVQVCLWRVLLATCWGWALVIVVNR